ncbi:MAG: radical SAM protein [archaeon]|nr:radical SAM protein [archaeon]
MVKNITKKYAERNEVIRNRGILVLVNSILLKIQKIYFPFKVIGKPQSIQIEISTKCNLKCVMCPLTSQEKKEKYLPHLLKPKNMGFEEFRKILDSFPRAGIIRINGIGEPLLNPEIEKMIAYCTENGILSVFNTNGTMLTEEKSRGLIESGASSVIISFDGANKKTFESIRIGANYDKVLENISSLVKLKKELKSELPKISIATVYMKQNREELEKIREMFRKIGVNDFITNNLNGPPNDEFSMKNRVIEPEKNAPISCVQPWDEVYININGQISPCCYAPYLNFGNIFEQDFDSTWNNSKYEQFRKNKRSRKSDICNNCPAYSVKKPGFF